MIFKKFEPIIRLSCRGARFSLPTLARGKVREPKEPSDLSVFRVQADITKEEVSNVHMNPALHFDTLRLSKNETSFYPSGSKCLRVSVLGVPNSGKSTFINKLVGHNVCAHSKKVHTTRTNARAVLTEDQTQIVFLDTPGIVTREESLRFNLESSLLKDPARACNKADLIIVLQDVSNRYVRESINKSILKLLCWNHNIPSVLVLNKMDTIPNSRRVYDLIRKLSCGHIQGEKQNFKVKQINNVGLDTYLKKKRRERDELRSGATNIDSSKIVINSYTDFVNTLDTLNLDTEIIENMVQGLVGWPKFNEIFTVSAFTGDGIESVRNFLLDNARESPWDFPRDVYTDDDPRDIVTRIVKAKFLDILPTDVPYSLKPIINTWIVENGVLRIGVEVDARSSRSIHLLLGNHAENLGKVAKLTETDLMNFFQCEVFVKITVNVNNNTPAKLSNTLKPEFVFL